MVKRLAATIGRAEVIEKHDLELDGRGSGGWTRLLEALIARPL